jgi:hypothetical protein
MATPQKKHQMATPDDNARLQSQVKTPDDDPGDNPDDNIDDNSDDKLDDNPDDNPDKNQIITPSCPLDLS